MDRQLFVTRRLIAALACLLVLVAGCAESRKRSASLEKVARVVGARPAYVTTYLAETDDHWKLGLHRYAPEKLDPSRMPVILCHGLGYNGSFWDLDQPHNFAEFLRQAGWDTWIVDLRGGGASSKPIWYWLRGLDTSFVRNPDFDPAKVQWDIEDYILRDVPAAVDFVKKETGAASVAWVGHSLGGAIAMCYLERTPDAPIGCLVAVASPVVVPKPGTFFQENIKDFRLAMTAINNRWQALAGAITLGRFKTPIDVVFYNEKNMAPLTIQLMYLRIAEDVPKPVVDQLLKMAETGELISPDGKFNYSKEVSRLTLPVFFIAGKVDHSADPEAVHYAYERVSSKDKTFRLFGLAWGDSIDYGHDDLILGKRSREEVYPVIEKWLQTRARLLAPASRPQKE